MLNKADYLSPTELREALRFTAAVLADVVGEPATVHPMSARQALSALATGDPRELSASGITSFEAAFVDYLDGRRGSDLRASVAAHASRIAAAARDADRLARTAAVLETDDLAARVVAFQARLAEVQQLGMESRALLHADIARLLGELGGAAQAQSAQLASGTRAAVERWLGQHPDGDLRQIEDSGRSMVEEQIRLGVDHWRVEQEHCLGDALSALGVRLAHRLDQQVQAVREAAADLFAVELLPPAASPALTVDCHFTYSFTDWGSITEPLAAAVRTRLPGRIGRRRVAEYLLGQIPGLAD